MKRNLKRFACCVTAAVLLCAVTPVGAGAEEAMPGYDGYIFKLRQDVEPMVLMSDEGDSGLPQGIQALEFGYFRADSLDDLAQLTEAGWLEMVEPDYTLELMDGEPFTSPNDPQYTAGAQWSLDAIGMGYAWENGYDGTGVTIGIVDSGIVQNHADMIYEGHVDGKNFLTSAADTTSLTDYLGHGSMVAGIIGATTNNGLGMAGIAPGAQLMALKIFGAADEGGKTSAACEAIKYGVDNGCDVINLSVGVFTPSAYLAEGVRYAQEHGVILVASAGNGNKDNNSYTDLSYPAACEGVIGVSRLDKSSDGTVAIYQYCQHNASVDVAAPGGNIMGLGRSSLVAYSTQSGTSFAAPMVAAAAALCKQAEPNLTPERFLELLAQCSVDGGDAGRDDYYGYGMLSVENLLRRLDEGDPWIQANQRWEGVVVSTGGLRAKAMAGGSVLALAAGYDADGKMIAAATATAPVAADGSVALEELTLDLPAMPQRVELSLLDPDTWSPLRDPILWTQE